MKRRTVAAIVAALLVVGLVVVAVLRPVPYVTFAPGPTVNVLGSYNKLPIIEVSGHPSYRDKGGLRLLTVIPSGPEDRVSLAQMVLAWADTTVTALVSVMPPAPVSTLPSANIRKNAYPPSKLALSTTTWKYVPATLLLKLKVFSSPLYIWLAPVRSPRLPNTEPISTSASSEFPT